MDVPLRTRLAGVSMTAGGLIMVVAPFFGTDYWSDDTRTRLALVAEHHEVILVRSLLFQASVLLLLPGVVAVIGRTRGRGSGLVVSGGCAYAAGLVGAFMFFAWDGLGAAFADGPVDRALVDASQRMESSVAGFLGAALTIFLFHMVGLPWLSAGMARARQVPWWLAAVATVGTGCAVLGSGTSLEDWGWAVVGLSLAAIGTTVVRPGLLTTRQPRRQDGSSTSAPTGPPPILRRARAGRR